MVISFDVNCITTCPCLQGLLMLQSTFQQISVWYRYFRSSAELPTLSRWWIIRAIRPASITACTWDWFPAVILDKNQTASCQTNTTRIISHLLRQNPLHTKVIHKEEYLRSCCGLKEWLTVHIGKECWYWWNKTVLQFSILFPYNLTV